MKRKQGINKTTEPIRVMSHYEKLSSFLLNRNLRDYALFNFGIYTGRRISDITALNVSDVIEAGMDKGRFKFKELLKIQEKKTGKFAEIPLTDNARKPLGKYLRQRRKESEKRGESVAEFMREPLFKSQKPRKDGEFRLTGKSAWRILRNGARACGMNEHMGTHSLRKTYGYILYHSGISIETIQKLLNHASPSITLAYIGIMQDDLNDAMWRMDIKNLRTDYEAF